MVRVIVRYLEKVDLWRSFETAMIFEQFIRANSYPVGKNKSFSTTEFIIKWFCLSMNLLHQLLSGSEEDEDEEEEQSFVRAERRNREQQEWQFSSEWDEKVMQSLPYRRRLKNLVPWQKVGKMLSYTKMECAHSGFSAPLYSALFMEKLPRICYGAGVVLSLWPLPSPSELRPGPLSE